MWLWRQQTCPSCRHRFRRRRGRRHCEACGAKLNRRWRWRLGLLTCLVFIIASAGSVQHGKAVLRSQISGLWRVESGRFADTTVEFTVGGAVLCKNAADNRFDLIEIGTFDILDARTIRLWHAHGTEAARIRVEIVGSDEIVCVNNQPFGMFRGISGRLRRIRH